MLYIFYVFEEECKDSTFPRHCQAFLRFSTLEAKKINKKTITLYAPSAVGADLVSARTSIRSVIPHIVGHPLVQFCKSTAIHDFIHLLAQVVTPLPLAYDIVEQGRGGRSKFASNERHECGHLNLVSIECQISLIDGTRGNLVFLSAGYITYDDGGGIGAHHTPFLVGLAADGLLLGYETNEHIKRLFGIVVARFFFQKECPWPGNSIVGDVAAQTAGQEIDVVLHQPAAVLLSVHVVQHDIGQQVVLHQINHHAGATQPLDEVIHAVLCGSGRAIDRVLGMLDTIYLIAVGH